eukprot:gene10193-12058_t
MLRECRLGRSAVFAMQLLLWVVLNLRPKSARECLQECAKTARVYVDHTMLTDAPLLYSPSQIALAALRRAGREHDLAQFETFVQRVASQSASSETLFAALESLESVMEEGAELVEVRGSKAAAPLPVQRHLAFRVTFRQSGGDGELSWHFARAEFVEVAMSSLPHQERLVKDIDLKLKKCRIWNSGMSLFFIFSTGSVGVSKRK